MDQDSRADAAGGRSGETAADDSAARTQAAMLSAGARVPRVPTQDAGNPPMYQRIGELTRMLHDALRALGLDTKLEEAAHSLPDARDRLSYIARLTGQAADRVLSAVERCQADQTALADAAAALAHQWSRHDARELSAEETDALIRNTRGLISGMPKRTAATQAQLHEIMMAQDFHDLTGQVIGRIAELVHTLEANLLALLVETRPAGMHDEAGGLSGPAIRPNAETAANQGEVDSLLESLGF